MAASKGSRPDGSKGSHKGVEKTKANRIGKHTKKHQDDEAKTNKKNRKVQKFGK